ncbi:MAG: SIMPL domain-containing protein [Anaerolineae bacterium]
MKRRIVVTLGLAAVVVAAGLLVSTSSASTANAQDVATPEAGQVVRSITVIGQGTVNAAPDVAQATIGVEAIAASVSEASTQATETMGAIITALTDMGVAAEDIQTAEYNVYVDTSAASFGTTTEPSYHVINMVSVAIRDLTAVGDVIDAAVQAGANRIYGVSFSISDTAAVEADAREQAVADARQRAEHLASLVDASVGDVISVSEGVTGGYQPFSSVAKAADGLGGGTSISPGQLQVTSSIQVVYELAPLGSAAEATPRVTGTAQALGTGTAEAVRTLVTSTTLTPADDTASYTIELASNSEPTEVDGEMFLIGWVYVTPDGETDPSQTLDVVFHTAFDRWTEGDQLVGGVDYIITDDINFDGYTDFAVVEPGGATWQVSHWYVYDADAEEFVTNEMTDQLSLLPWNSYSLDAGTREITVTNMLGATGEVETVYYIALDGGLALVSADEGAPTIEGGPFSGPTISG